ncbi:protein MOR1 [Tanacetum coccineum]
MDDEDAHGLKAVPNFQVSWMKVDCRCGDHTKEVDSLAGVEKNVQVQPQVIEVVSHIASTATKFPKKCVVLCIAVYIFACGQTSKIMKEHKNPKVLSEGLLWMVFAVDDFGVAHLKLKDVFDFCKDIGLQSSAAATTIIATIKLIGVLHKLVGSDMKAFLSDVMPALLSVVEVECEKNPFENNFGLASIYYSFNASMLMLNFVRLLGRTDFLTPLSKQLGLPVETKDRISLYVCMPLYLVMKNVSDIQGPALAIVLERLKSHGVFPEVHDKTRARPTVKTTSKIGKSNWLSQTLEIHVYLQEAGLDEIRSEETYRVGARANDLPMLKTLLYELCKLHGTAITGHLSMVPIDMEPQRIILAYIDLNLQVKSLTDTDQSLKATFKDSNRSTGTDQKPVCRADLREVSAKGSKAESIMSVQYKSGPVGSRLAFTPTEPQRESHLMPQPSVIGPTDWNEATPTSVDGMKVICHEFEAISKDLEVHLVDDLITDADRLVSCLAAKVLQKYRLLLLKYLLVLTCEAKGFELYCTYYSVERNSYGCIAAMQLKKRLVELFGALRARLYDSNQNLIMATLTSISGLESAMGPAIEKSSKGIVSDIVKCIGDNKKHMRECADGRTDAFLLGIPNKLAIQAIVLERLKSHGVFPEVHDKTRATRTGPTVKTTSKIGKSNWLSKQIPSMNIFCKELGN